MTFAFVFPGQGSQSVGMLDAFADNAVVRETVAEASDALGLDMAKLIAAGPAEELNLTTNTQPVMLTAAYAMYRAWLAEGGATPAFVAGHSLGEYSALVAAGVIAFKDAVPLVRFRAQAMQEAVPVGQGGMAAILGLDDDTVRQVCAEASAAGVVEAVNFNAPAQVVIAGAKAGVEKACELAKAAGAKRARAELSRGIPESLAAEIRLRAGSRREAEEERDRRRRAREEEAWLHQGSPKLVCGTYVIRSRGRTAPPTLDEKNSI